ncbi:MAG: hypothetical protein V1908_01295 [Candidatus Peregrinibacteria bacterium]
MRKRTINKLVFLLSLVLAGAVYAWFYPLNTGTLELKTGTTDYQVFLNGEPLECTQDPCSTKLKVDGYQLLIRKEKHATFSQLVFIHRGEVSTVEVNLERVYTLEPSSVVPKTNLKRALTPPADLSAVPAFAWNAKGSTFIFLDPADERVKVRQANGSTRVITSLANLASPLNFYWSPTETWLLAQQGRDLYFINTAEATRKKKVLKFEPIVILWSPQGDYALVNDASNALYRITPDNQTISATDVALNLEEAAWINDATLLSYSLDTQKRRTEIKTYEPGKTLLATLTVRFDYVAVRMIFDAANQTAYFQNDQGDWDEMKFF